MRRYLETNQLKLAEHELLMALAQHPESPSASRLMGSLQAQLGNFHAASEWTQRYLAYQPADSLALTLLAATLEKSGSLGQSTGLFKRAEQSARSFQDFFEISVEADRQGIGLYESLGGRGQFRGRGRNIGGGIVPGGVPVQAPFEHREDAEFLFGLDPEYRAGIGEDHGVGAGIEHGRVGHDRDFGRILLRTGEGLDPGLAGADGRDGSGNHGGDGG